MQQFLSDIKVEQLARQCVTDHAENWLCALDNRPIGYYHRDAKPEVPTTI